MNKKLLLISLLATSMLLTSCGTKKSGSNSSGQSDSGSSSNSSSEDPGEVVPEGKVRLHLPSSLSNKQETYNLDFDYDLAYFKQDAREYHKDVAILSFGGALENQNKEMIKNYYERIGFDNSYTCEAYDSEPTEDSIGFYLGHAKVDNDDIIAVSIRGWNYSKEWSSNLKVGTTINHEGFDESATVVYDKLQEYIATFTIPNLKLWISGYSRAGGVANVVASKILSGTEISVNPEDMFVYTFEAPRGLALENATNYSNVFNMINDPDIVPQIAPEAYGLYRCGRDISIYKENIDEIVTSFDDSVVLPTFKPHETIDEEEESLFTNEIEFSHYLISTLLEEHDYWEDEKKGWTIDNTAMNTRERFVNNYQEMARDIMSLVFSLKSSTTDAIMSDFSDKMENDPYALMMLLVEDALFEYLKPFLDEDGIAYDADKIKDYTNLITQKFLQTVGLKILSMAMSYADNLSRMIKMHFPEISYALIVEYNPEA